MKETRQTRMLHYSLVFDNVFERKESKYYAVLMKHHCEVKGEQVITPQMPQQLKTKNIKGNYFVVSVKLNFGYCIDDQDKSQSVTDTGNEFTECQTPRKKLQ